MVRRYVVGGGSREILKLEFEQESSFSYQFQHGGHDGRACWKVALSVGFVNHLKIINCLSHLLTGFINHNSIHPNRQMFTLILK